MRFTKILRSRRLNPNPQVVEGTRSGATLECACVDTFFRTSHMVRSRQIIHHHRHLVHLRHQIKHRYRQLSFRLPTDVQE